MQDPTEKEAAERRERGLDAIKKSFQSGTSIPRLFGPQRQHTEEELRAVLAALRPAIDTTRKRPSVSYIGPEGEELRARDEKRAAEKLAAEKQQPIEYLGRVEKRQGLRPARPGWTTMSQAITEGTRNGYAMRKGLPRPDGAVTFDELNRLRK